MIIDINDKWKGSRVTLEEFVNLIQRSGFTREELLSGVRDERCELPIEIEREGLESVIPLFRGDPRRLDYLQSIPLNSDVFRVLVNQVIDDFNLGGKVGYDFVRHRDETGLEMDMGQLIRWLYHPQSAYSKNHTLNRKATDLYWGVIDYLVEQDHPARFDIGVNVKARTGPTKLGNVQVKDSFYTGRAPDAWVNRSEERREFVDLRVHPFLVSTSSNHTETYLVKGSELRNGEDCVLVRTGNPITGLQPVARIVDEIGQLTDRYVGYRTRGMPLEDIRAIIKKVDIVDSYLRVREMAQEMIRAG